MWRKSCSVLVAFLTCLSLAAPRASAAPQEGEAASEIVVPGNLTMALELLSPLSTAVNKKGDKFDCKVLSPVQYNGAIVSGHVSKAKSSGKANKKSEMDLDFDAITLADGRKGRFDAQVKEVNDVKGAADGGVADPEGTVKGKSRVSASVKRAAAGALIGALIGGAVAGGKGAAAGAAIGAAAGLTTTLATDGPNLEFASGTQFTVLTNAPPRGKRPTPVGQTAATGLAGGTPSNGVAPNAATAAPAARVAAPSATLRPFRIGAASLNIPDNWRETVAGNSVALVPDGAHIAAGPQSGYTHGMMIGTSRASATTLQQSAESLVKAYAGVNSYLKHQGQYIRGQLAGRDALAAVLTGRWPATGRDEIVTIYATKLRGGELFYVITFAPHDEYKLYSPVFVNVMRSLRLSD